MSSNGGENFFFHSFTLSQEDERNRLILRIKVLETNTGLVYPRECSSYGKYGDQKRKWKTENILHGLGRRLHPMGYTLRSSILDFQIMGYPITESV